VNEEKKPLMSAATLGKEPLAIGAVPWDPEKLQGRDCGRCACYFEQANPENTLQSQGFCRRLPADMQQMRGMEPRKDLQGNIVLKDGKQVMQPTTIIGYLFKPTKRDGTCFDGFRPIGSLPGEGPIDVAMRRAVERMRPMFERMPADLRTVLCALFDIDQDSGTRN
jgi:hypothetical protein